MRTRSQRLRSISPDRIGRWSRVLLPPWQGAKSGSSGASCSYPDYRLNTERMVLAGQRNEALLQGSRYSTACAAPSMVMWSKCHPGIPLLASLGSFGKNLSNDHAPEDSLS
jgi:hypothetical protein